MEKKLTLFTSLEGESIDEDQTPDDLVLKDGANIDAFVRQVAGSF